MKKWLIAPLLLLLLLSAYAYLFIPNIISISQSISINANRDGLYRHLSDEKNWGKWWPESSTMNNKDNLSRYVYNDYTYTITNKKFLSLPVSITQKDTIAITSLIFISTVLDSTNLYWEAAVPTSYNPLKRLKTYFKAKQITNDMKALLGKMHSFFSKTENVYGYDIRQGAIVNSTLVSTFNISKGYPGTEFIYGLIARLKKYIASQSAKEIASPIMEITTTDSINFYTRVAIPVDKQLPPSGNIDYKWMPPGVTFFAAEVKGGPSAINKAYRQIESYMNDHQTVIATTPFHVLETDRSQQPDSSKWITRLCFPFN